MILTTNMGDRVIFKTQPRDNVYPGDFKVTVILPGDYEKSLQRYPVLYSFDAIDLSRERDELERQKFIQPIILVAIDNRAPRSRRYDLTPTQASRTTDRTGGLTNFTDTLIYDIKPYIDAHFRTLPDASHTGVTGFSLGGLAAFLMGTQHPEIFGRIGAMEPAVWWGDTWASIENFRDRPLFKAAKPRIWIMGSELDSPNAWRAIRLTAQTFLDKGWVEGDDLAFCQVHNMGHGWASCLTQTRDMLYFLYRTEKPNLVDARLNICHGAQDQPIHLAQTGEAANLCLDLFFRGGFRATAISPVLISSDPNVVAVGDLALGQLWPQGSGWAVVSGKYKGVDSSLAVEGCSWQNQPRFPIASNATHVEVDGDLSDWPQLPFSSARAVNSLLSSNGFDFDVSMDSSNLYCAISVKDSSPEFRPELGDNFNQDGLEICIDARPDPVRSMGRGYEKNYDFICIRLAPGETNGSVLLGHFDNLGPVLPQGAKVATRRTNSGYAAEISVPLSVLQSEYEDAPKAFHWNGDKPLRDDDRSPQWKEFRLNICQFDKGKDGKIQQIEWQPLWDGPNNIVGSGTFSQ